MLSLDRDYVYLNFIGCTMTDNLTNSEEIGEYGTGRDVK